MDNCCKINKTNKATKCHCFVCIKGSRVGEGREGITSMKFVDLLQFGGLQTLMTPPSYTGYADNTFFVIFAVLDVSFAVNLCLNCSFLHSSRYRRRYFRYIDLPLILIYTYRVSKNCIFSQPSICIDGWLYAMRVTSVVCNVPVLSQNDSTYHHSVFSLHDMKVTSLRYLDAKFHHPSLGASPPNRGKTVFACLQNSRYY